MKNAIILITLLSISAAAFSQKDDATFKILSVAKLEKSKELAEEKRNVFAKLPEAQWNSLPLLMQVTFEFKPIKGNTDDMGDTFYLSPVEMALKIGDTSYPSIGVLSPFGFRQRYSSNSSPNSAGVYDSEEMTMWFLVPKDTKAFDLLYKEVIVAKGTIE